MNEVNDEMTKWENDEDKGLSGVNQSLTQQVKALKSTMLEMRDDYMATVSGMNDKIKQMQKEKEELEALQQESENNKNKPKSRVRDLELQIVGLKRRLAEKERVAAEREIEYKATDRKLTEMIKQQKIAENQSKCSTLKYAKDAPGMSSRASSVCNLNRSTLNSSMMSVCDKSSASTAKPALNKSTAPFKSSMSRIPTATSTPSITGNTTTSTNLTNQRARRAAMAAARAQSALPMPLSSTPRELNDSVSSIVDTQSKKSKKPTSTSGFGAPRTRRVLAEPKVLPIRSMKFMNEMQSSNGVSKSFLG